MRQWFALVLVHSLAILNASASGAEPVENGVEISLAGAAESLLVVPAEVRLIGGDAVQRLLVLGPLRESRRADRSRDAVYESQDVGIASVSADGLIVPHRDGEVEIEVRLGDQASKVRVVVEDFQVAAPVSFRNQVEPILSRVGCNAGGCHGKASGQNGFKLSLLGSDPSFDFNAIVKESRGRRVFPAHPAQSLLLLKGAGAVPHGGGRRLELGSKEYDLLHRWIQQGMPVGSADDPKLVRIACTPRSAIVGPRAEHQVIVTAYFSDGTHRDVTREAQFKSNEPEIAQVEESGLVRTSDANSETAIMTRYINRVDVCQFSIPQASSVSEPWPDLPRGNFIDEPIRAKWRKLNLTPSPLADDATFLRRLFLDVIGTLPTADEVRRFLDDPSPEKRAAWVDVVLDRGEYADYWAVKWGDLLRNQRKNQRENQRGTYAFHAWIRNAIAANLPYDQFVRGIVAAQGTVDQHPPVIWYRTVRNLTHQTNDTAQLFLGTRIACAQCHNHPYERWTQDDYYGLQAFFARLGRKPGEISQEPAIFVRQDGQVRHPTTGKVMVPHGLDGPEVLATEDEDPRQLLVDWMARPENPFFAAALTNRVWGHFMGRGLVEPVDDLRVTNPASNPQLLDALAHDFVAHRYDVKHLIRQIVNSTAYQLSSEPSPGNRNDRQNYARAYPRRMPAEVMLDAICQVTGSAESFAGMPQGTRAIQLPDEAIASTFLDVFGRPPRETPCECERPREANLAQALQLLNSGDLQAKITTPRGRLASWLEDTQKSNPEILEELYLTALGRRPRDSERTTLLTYVGGKSSDRTAAFQDVLWALLNTKEFLFNH